MPDEDRLRDIVEHGRVAAELAAAGARAVNGDVVSRLALERALFIIGEAAGALSDETRAAIDAPWSDVIGLRNVLAHRYDELSAARLVQIAGRDVPALLRAIGDLD